MQAVLIRDVGGYELLDLPVPRPGPGEALIRVHVTGLCRTDLKLIRHGHRDLVLPRVPGEEVVGEVVAFGPPLENGADAIPIALGDLVYVYPGVWCGECPACARGAENLCRHMRIMGFHRDGGFAEFVSAPVQSLIALPAGLPPEVAVFAEPLSCCLNALELGGVGHGDVLGIWGAGPAGSLLARAGAARGANVVVIEPDERRRAWIGGQAAPPALVDVAVVAVGAREAYVEAMDALAPRGRLVVFSGLLPEADKGLIVGLNRLHYFEQTVVGAYGCSFRHGVDALDLLAAGVVPVADLITHRLPLEAVDDAMALIKSGEAGKIIFQIG